MTIQIQVSKAELRDAVRLMARVIERRNTIPVLSRMLWRVDPARYELAITATDLDIEVVRTIDCHKAEGQRGAFTVPVSALRAMLIGDGVIDVTHDNGRITISADGCRCEIRNAIPAEDFPIFDATTASFGVEVPQAKLAEMIRFVTPAISTEVTRYYLQGIYIHGDAKTGAMRMITTDGHRMNSITSDLPWSGAGGIWPAKTCAVLLAALDSKANEAARIRAGEARAEVVIGRTTIRTKLIDGTYPDYTRVVPSYVDGEPELRAIVTREAVRRLYGSQRSAAVRVDLDKGEMSAVVPDEDLKVTVPCHAVSGREAFGVNLKYLRAALDLEPELLVKTSGAGDPLVLTGEKQDRFQIIMPMRV